MIRDDSFSIDRADVRPTGPTARENVCRCVRLLKKGPVAAGHGGNAASVCEPRAPDGPRNWLKKNVVKTLEILTFSCRMFTFHTFYCRFSTILILLAYGENPRNQKRAKRYKFQVENDGPKSNEKPGRFLIGFSKHIKNH